MLTLFDWIIIAVYLIAMIWIGIATRGKQDSSADYFIAHGGLSGVIGMILIGLSIAATFFSGITFLAYPGVVYKQGLLILMGLPTFLVAWLVLRFYFLPRYISGHWPRPYEVLERRYGVATRRTAAVLLLMVRIAWMGTLIYAPTLALIAAAGLDDKWFWPLVLTIGLSSTFYTVFGGIRGVIVTDAIQFLIIIVGIAATLAFIIMKLPVPVGDALSQLHDAGRLRWWDGSFSFTRPLTFWGVLIGVSVANLGSYVGDQISLQRYLTCKNVQEASKSFLINIVGVVIVLVLLAAVGVALAAWYMLMPASDMPQSVDQVLPFFVARELPMGLAGLLLAAILAATMSSITGGTNAMAAVVVMDFRSKKASTWSGRHELLYARMVSLAIGVISTIASGLVGYLGDLFDIAQRLFGVFLGPLAVCLLLAVSPIRIRGIFVQAGLLLGCIAGWLAVFPSVAQKMELNLGLPVIDSVWTAAIAGAVTLVVALAGARWGEPVAAAEVGYDVEPRGFEPKLGNDPATAPAESHA